VADVVEAMSSHRPYRPALGVGAAIAEISENTGRFYDGDAATACMELFRQGFSFEKENGTTFGCALAERAFKAWEKT
jgi:HD-GYP domain-containing protein (c-di-GMP phosphodiesterase class II)